MSTSKYLDYSGLQYYHQKLNLELNSFSINENDIVIPGTEVKIDKTLTLPYNGIFKIRMASEYASSDPVYEIPVEWYVNRTTFPTINSNTEYTFPNAFSTQNTQFYVDSYNNLPLRMMGELDGLSIELFCQDENENTHYYTTMGRQLSQCSDSEYDVWDGVLSNYGGEDIDYGIRSSEFWNFINFEIPIGKSQTFHLNYHSDHYINYYDDLESDETYEEYLSNNEAEYFPSKEFQINLIRNTKYDYSIIFYWECVQ